MTPRLRAIAVLLLAAVFLGHGGVATAARAARPQSPPPAVNAADLAQRIHALINAERARHGLTSLSWDAALARIAARHSRDMARRNYLSHDSPEGQNFAGRYRQAGYSCAIRIGRVIHAGAENIALSRLYNSATIENGTAYYDWNSPQAIARKTVDGWMHSPGHRKNILTPYWRHEGIGVEVAPDNKVYVTQNFC